VAAAAHFVFLSWSGSGLRLFARDCMCCRMRRPHSPVSSCFIVQPWPFLRVAGWSLRVAGWFRRVAGLFFMWHLFALPHAYMKNADALFRS